MQRTDCKHIYQTCCCGYCKKLFSLGNYSFKEQYLRVKSLLKDSHSKEACQNAKGNSKQEKVCNLVFKSKITIVNLLLGKAR